MLFVNSGIKKEFQSQIANAIAVKKENVPCLMLIFNDEENGNGLKKFRWDGDLNTLTVDDIEMFISDWEADILTPILKSEKPPFSQFGPVYTLVGTTHDEFAY